ncbi:Rad23 UV excision repair protein family [Striga asiatica]|uniref:Rad23 UV excision repair protein family n=1 Tax=Striga asiatica TaxID=4170 RepID=A0A5A7PFM7_STRAF|nr:Rad23 UV excision repair protein family [Striga asiatica]
MAEIVWRQNDGEIFGIGAATGGHSPVAVTTPPTSTTSISTTTSSPGWPSSPATTTPAARTPLQQAFIGGHIFIVVGSISCSAAEGFLADDMWLTKGNDGGWGKDGDRRQVVGSDDDVGGAG